jgi:hypothetical protein
MILHVLPGDALAEKFNKTGLNGEIAICRECLIEGDVKAENINDFWETRANFIKLSYDESKEQYFKKVAAELQKLNDLAPGTNVYLWFEHELFCQANMWFCLDLLSETKATVYRVAPVIKDAKNVWTGFGKLDIEDLRQCFERKIKFEKDDISLGANLWKAYQNSDHETLESLSETNSACFPFLKEVCRAEIEKDSRPRKILEQIAENGTTDFSEIFSEFSRRAGVYGFGDAQLKRIMQEI